MTATPSPLPSDVPEIDQGYVTVIATTGPGYEQLRQEVFSIPPFLYGHSARVKIVDNSTSGHINVDLVSFTNDRPPLHTTPVWGYADYHTHPMDYLAFGGLKGQRTIWGSPGGNYDDYQRDRTLIERDLPRCERGHRGGPFANPFLNGAQKMEFSTSISLLLFAHGKNGAPTFRDWPSFIAGTHEQMHITQIHRNYEGGLRVLVALATDNLGAEYIASKVEKRHVRLISEKDSVKAQLAGMADLVRANSAWMQIASSPEEARAIILHGRLAVILGVEVDQLGTYGFSKPEDEVDYLWKLGVRTVTPIHAIDNNLGGPAVFTAPYNWANDLLHREPGSLDLSRADLSRPEHSPVFFATKTESCGTDPTNDGECVQFRFEPTQNRVYLGRCLESFFRTSPCLYKTSAQYDTTAGQKNTKGLTDTGNEYIKALMNRGMIVDSAHMSDQSLSDLYRLVTERVTSVHPDCSPTFLEDTSNPCDEFAYPVIISHAHFRAQATYGEDNGFEPSEYDISNSNLALVKKVGGVVGPFVGEDRISTTDGLPFKPDCALSSKKFGYSFDFAQQSLGGSGVGMATDFTLILGTAPRFGEHACWGYRLTKDPRQERKFHAKRYAIDAQKDGVIYEGMRVRRGVSGGQNFPLKYSEVGKRKYDFNVDGLAHFGMVPDMLQDLKNVGFPRYDFESMFSSAEGYLEMWEKARHLATLDETGNH